MIVDLLPTEEQAMISESVAAFFSDRLPVARFHSEEKHGAIAEIKVWNDLAGLGLFGLGVPADRGGVGYSICEEATVAFQMGAFLISPTVLATMLAAHGGGAQSYASGRRACFANLLPAPSGGVGDLHIVDGTGADDWLLVGNGRAHIVPAGKAQPIAGMDETIALSKARAEAVHSNGQGTEIYTRFELLIAAYLTGMAKAALDIAVAYAQVREQFGRPIGSFQALKHICADMALRVEAAHSLTCYTAALTGVGTIDPAGAANARLLATEAALTNARANIQIHGGMGFTDEAEAHHYLKRGQMLATLGTNRYRLQSKILSQAIAAH